MKEVPQIFKEAKHMKEVLQRSQELDETIRSSIKVELETDEEDHAIRLRTLQQRLKSVTQELIYAQMDLETLALEVLGKPNFQVDESIK